MYKRVGILRGGVGDNYYPSLKRGGEIISYLHENLGDKYKPVDILIDREGVWCLAGRPVQLSDLMHRVDLIWNVAHANFSHSLDSLAIPHLSESPFFSALKGSRELLREHMKSVDVSLPRTILIPAYQEDFDGSREKYAIKKAKEVHARFGAPWLVKSLPPAKDMGPVRGREGSQRPSASNGMGVHFAKTFPELVAAIEDGVQHQASILVEEFISDRTASLHSASDFRNEEVYVFPLGRNNMISAGEREKISTLAKDLHRHFGAEHYLKTDFAFNPRGRIYLLNFESTPELTHSSHFSEICESAGAKVRDLVEHMLERSLN